VGQAFVVGHQHQGGAAFLVEFEQQVADALAGVAVEVAGGFVGKQHVRFGGERAGNRHALLFAAGELARRVGQALAQADALSNSVARSRASLRPSSSSGSMTFSRALRLSSNWNDWKTKPTCSARMRARWSSSRCSGFGRRE
jgi:hypothetical protein